LLYLYTIIRSRGRAGRKERREGKSAGAVGEGGGGEKGGKGRGEGMGGEGGRGREGDGGRGREKDGGGPSEGVSDLDLLLALVLFGPHERLELVLTRSAHCESRDTYILEGAREGDVNEKGEKRRRRRRGDGEGEGEGGEGGGENDFDELDESWRARQTNREAPIQGHINVNITYLISFSFSFDK